MFDGTAEIEMRKIKLRGNIQNIKCQAPRIKTVSPEFPFDPYWGRAGVKRAKEGKGAKVILD